MKNRFILFFIVLFLLMLISPAYSVDVPLNLQAMLALKILSMDRNFDRFGDPVKVGVSSDEFLKEFKALEGKLKISGKNFVTEKMASPDDVAKYKVIFVGINWEKNYKAVSQKAVESKCLMFCENEKGVKSGGGAISFKVVSSKPRIVINPGNVKAQGSDFPQSFIKGTVVVGK